MTIVLHPLICSCQAGREAASDRLLSLSQSAYAGDEGTMEMGETMKKEEPESDVRWPSPARSDSECEEGPPRQGQKRHPKVRLRPKAVQRLNHKRARNEASELPSTAAANGTGDGELRNQQSVTRVKKGPVVNKVRRPSERSRLGVMNLQALATKFR